jgi:hypothetical protein
VTQQDKEHILECLDFAASNLQGALDLANKTEPYRPVNICQALEVIRNKIDKVTAMAGEVVVSSE